MQKTTSLLSLLSALLSALLLYQPGPASAGTCPDFYRFVDFGLKGRDDVLYRGGSLLRAEGFDGAALLEFKQTKCLPVEDVAKDGRGNPIPVVAAISYSPEQTAINLTELSVVAVPDANTAAEKNTENHRNKLEQEDTVITQGSNFLCAGNPDKATTSCQVVSPYPGNTALVVYCDTAQCQMPVMAIDKKIVVNATWPRNPRSVGNDELTGNEIINTTKKIHDFLHPLTSLNPG